MRIARKCVQPEHVYVDSNLNTGANSLYYFIHLNLNKRANSLFYYLNIT